MTMFLKLLYQQQKSVVTVVRKHQLRLFSSISINHNSNNPGIVTSRRPHFPSALGAKTGYGNRYYQSTEGHGKLDCEPHVHHSDGRPSPYVVCAVILAGIIGYKVLDSKVEAREITQDCREQNGSESSQPAGSSTKSKTYRCDSQHSNGSSNVSGCKLSLEAAIEISRDLAQRIKDESGSPGLSIAVSVDGQMVWSEGLGYADLENRLPCRPETVMRIASISKPITMAAVARLWENGDLDLDKPVQFYVPEFPEKYWQGEKVTITTRQLLCHKSGIRHYNKDYMKQHKEGDDKQAGNSNQSTQGKGGNSKDKTLSQSNSSKTSSSSQSDAEKSTNSQSNATSDEMKLDEYYIMKNYASVIKSLDLFKDDPLVHKPGSNFLYTTHGWTLISAVAERAAKIPFEKFLRGVLEELGLENTYLEEHTPLIYNRGRHYVKKKKNGFITNAPYTDLSYKWAGGGLISNVLDVVKFGNMMLYSYQATQSTTGTQSNKGDNSISNQVSGEGGVDDKKAYLKPDTVRMLWSPEKNTDLMKGCFGLGWQVFPDVHEYAFCRERPFFVSHTGGALGASSVLLILPYDAGESNKGRQPCDVEESNKERQLYGNVEEESSVKDKYGASGVVVAIIVNMTSVGLNKTAHKIAAVFDRVER